MENLKKTFMNKSIREDGKIIAKFIKMGMDIKNGTNHRVRGIIEADNGDYLFLEFICGNSPSKDYLSTKVAKKNYEQKYPFKHYVYLDFCFRVDNPEDFLLNHSDKYHSYSGKAFYDLEYTNENIVKVLQVFNKDIVGIELVDDYYIDDYCDEMGFYTLHDHRLKHNYEAIKINYMGKHRLVLVTKYSCDNYNNTIHYEDESTKEYKNYNIYDLYEEYGRETIDKLIEDYNNEIKNIFSNEI